MSFVADCPGVDWAARTGCCPVFAETDWPYDYVETQPARSLHSSREYVGSVLLWSQRGQLYVHQSAYASAWGVDFEK